MSKQFWQPCLRFLHYLFLHFFGYDCTYRAAALTYTSLLAMVPLMVVSFNVLAAFPIFKGLGQQIQDFIFSNFVPASGQVLQSYLQNFVQQASQLTVIGSLFLVVTSILLLFTIEQSFNAIWNVTRHRRLAFAFIVYWAALTLLPILIGASFAISTYLINFLHINGVLLRFTPFTLTTIAFMLLYIAIPNRHVPFLSGLLGGVIAAVLFEMAKYCFAIFIKHFPTYQLLYGALATFPIFLVWLYISWVIVLFGAIISSAFTQLHYFRTGLRLDGFSHAVYWIGKLWAAQQQGNILSFNQLVKSDKVAYSIDPEILLKTLLDAKLIQRMRGNYYILARDVTTLTLHELMYRLPWPLPKAEQFIGLDVSWSMAYKNQLSKIEQLLATQAHLPLSSLFEA